MRGSAPDVAEQPQRQAGIEQARENAPRRGAEHGGEGFAVEVSEYRRVGEAHLPIEGNLSTALCEHLHQRILHQQNSRKDDEKAESEEQTGKVDTARRPLQALGTGMDHLHTSVVRCKLDVGS